jgi:PHD/YefM family antitoxin component YafN of YafNO toxin-antitoxin module
MFKDQCISVTELRTNTRECLQGLEKEPKYIFINNRPVAVLIDINAYEEALMKPDLLELPIDQVDNTLKKQIAAAKKSKKSDLIDIK